MIIKKKSKSFLLILLSILVLGLIVRLYKINIPLADHHSWRQADTAAVARNFVEEKFDFLRPRIDNFTPLHAPNLPNSDRLFLAEPPIYNSIVALVYYFGGVKESLARLVSIIFSLGSIVFLYLLVRKLLGNRVALLAAFFMAVLPYSIFYSRVILPEPMMVFLSLVMLYFYINWLEKPILANYLLSLFFTSLALTQKTFPIFLGLPMAYLTLKQWGLGIFKGRRLIWLVVYLILGLLPLILWRIWISRYPAGVPPYDWLLNQGGIRFRPAFFRWLFIERIGKLILGIWGLPVFGLGLILKPKAKFSWFFHFWLLSFLIYITVFAAGNVTHDYYQIPFIPLAAVFLAQGTNFLISHDSLKIFSRFSSIIFLIVCLVLMISYSWFQVRDFYNIQGGVDLAGKAVDSLTPKNSLILTGDSNDATLLYNCHRHGWTGGYASYFPNITESIEKARTLGAEYYVTTKINEIENSDFGRYLTTKYKVIQKTNQFVIVDLR